MIPPKSPATRSVRPFWSVRSVSLVVLITGALTGSLVLFYRSHPFSNDYFHPPLEIPLQLAANFGELREDHFHMGLDIRTMGRTGLPVHAAAEGYVSHIMIEPYGLGKALFIIHPNGQTTVYGHLDRFTPPLQQLILRCQYATERREQELDLKPGSFPVRQGELIAYSGNTGASQAPHLHFEVRDTNTGRNINPLLAGLSIPDEEPPVILGLYWYDRRYSTYLARAQKIAIVQKNGLYQAAGSIPAASITTRSIPAGGIVTLSSPLVSLGISAIDKASNSPHLSGIFHAECWLDDSLIHAFDLSAISTTDTRYINACIDYSKWIRSGIYVQHLSTLPGNHLSIFNPRGRDGLIRLKDTGVHKIHIRVSDVYHNHSDLGLRVRYKSPAGSRVPGHSSPGAPNPGLVSYASIPGEPLPGNRNIQMLSPGRENNVNDPSVRIYFSAAAFYDQVPFCLVVTTNTGQNKASPLIHLHDATVPVHDRFSVQLRTTLPPGSPLRSRTVMQLISGDSGSIIKGVWQGDWMCGSFTRLGDLQLLIDTTPPTIETIGWTSGFAFPKDQPALHLRCKDDLGAIARFRAELDGHWILFEQRGYDYWYDFDEHCVAGSHRLLVRVTDVAGNETRTSFSFSTR